MIRSNSSLELKLDDSALLKRLAEEVETATASRKTRRISDGNGLMLVIRPNGQASWIFRYTFHSKLTDYTLGHWPTLALNDARAKAHEARCHVALGHDPAALRASERWIPQVNPSADTVQGVFNEWIVTAKAHASTAYQQNITSALTRHVLPAVGTKRLQDLTIGDLIKITRTIESQGAKEMSRRVLMWLLQLFEFAIVNHKSQILLAPLETASTHSASE